MTDGRRASGTGEMRAEKAGGEVLEYSDGSAIMFHS